MSKDITIEVNGVAQALEGVEAIRTPAADSGTVDWLPETETVVQPLNITENGTYTPGEGVYGFAPVSVSVPASSVTGTINGVTYVVTVDANGYLVYTPA